MVVDGAHDRRVPGRATLADEHVAHARPHTATVGQLVQTIRVAAAVQVLGRTGPERVVVVHHPQVTIHELTAIPLGARARDARIRRAVAERVKITARLAERVIAVRGHVVERTVLDVVRAVVNAIGPQRAGLGRERDVGQGEPLGVPRAGRARSLVLEAPDHDKISGTRLEVGHTLGIDFPVHDLAVVERGPGRGRRGQERARGGEILVREPVRRAHGPDVAVRIREQRGVAVALFEERGVDLGLGVRVHAHARTEHDALVRRLHHIGEQHRRRVRAELTAPGHSQKHRPHQGGDAQVEELH